MSNKKTGNVLQINHNDGIGIIKEDNTATEYIFFLDELTQYEMKHLRIHSTVTFFRSEEFEQFVAEQIEASEMSYRKVV